MLYASKHQHVTPKSTQVYRIGFPEDKEFWCEYIFVVTKDVEAKIRILYRNNSVISSDFVVASVLGSTFKDRFQFSVPIVLKSCVDIVTCASSDIEVYLGGRLVDEMMEPGTRRIPEAKLLDALKRVKDEQTFKRPVLIRKFNFDE